MEAWLTSSATGILGYCLIGGVAFLEAVVFTSLFAPGTVAVVLAGALVAKGTYAFLPMACSVSVGTVLGAEISFRVGTRATRLFTRNRRLLSRRNLARGRRLFRTYGPVSIVLGHFIGPLRPVMPVVAGLSAMAPRRFLLWNAAGGVSYALVFLSLGYFSGRALSPRDMLGVQSFLLLIVAALLAALVWRRKVEKSD